MNQGQTRVGCGALSEGDDKVLTQPLYSSQTNSVEGGSIELRHHLGWLVRRSRCFTCSLWALRDAVKLFVYAWNRRQLFRRVHPKYPAHVFQFVRPPS